MAKLGLVLTFAFERDQLRRNRLRENISVSRYEGFQLLRRGRTFYGRICDARYEEKASSSASVSTFCSSSPLNVLFAKLQHA